MWYSYRAQQNYRTLAIASYRIGYAESSDGLSWKRMDDRAFFEPSDSGWDSFMVAYPEVFEFNGKLIMLYNGNGFGESGFGYAESVLL